MFTNSMPNYIPVSLGDEVNNQIYSNNVRLIFKTLHIYNINNILMQTVLFKTLWYMAEYMN